jgi:multicomponent Na+:H+ antiporter subunit E
LTTPRTLPFAVAAAVALGLLWLGLTGGEWRALVVGAPVVLLATATAVATDGLKHLPRPAPLPGFMLGFIADLARSAWDIARRVLARDPGFAPGTQVYRLRLRGDGARAAFMNAITLTPGTLSAALDGDRLTVHALNPGEAVSRDLAALEGRVGRLYGEKPA